MTMEEVHMHLSAWRSLSKGCCDLAGMYIISVP